MGFGFMRNMNSLFLSCFVISPIFLSLVAIAEIWDYKQNIAKCQSPDLFSAEWNLYVNNFCSMKEEHYLGSDDVILDKDERFELVKFPLRSVLWLAFLVMGSLCWAPKLFAKVLSIFDNSYEYLYHKIPPHSDEPIGYASTRISSFLAAPRSCIFKKLLVLKNLVVSLSILALSLLQLYILSNLLGFKQTFNGFNVFHNGLEAISPINEQGPFPEIILCDFDIRSVGSNIQHFSIQCALPHSLFSKQLCTLVWFWFVCLAMFSGLSILKQLATNFIPVSHTSFMRSIMPFSDYSEYQVSSVREKLGLDGIYVLRRMMDSGDFALAAETVCRLGDPDIRANAWNTQDETIPYNQTEQYDKEKEAQKNM